MEFQSGLVRTASLDMDVARREVAQVGCATFVLPAEGIVDRETFFDAVKATLPLDPPLLGNHSWDAMSDSLWEGLSTIPERRVAILWPNARAMAGAASSDFETAIDMLTDVSASLADPLATRGSVKELVVVVEISP